MPLPRSQASRQLRHHRQIDIQVYARDDGLWEVDARISDVKTRDAHLAGGVRPAGKPIHDMLLRLVVDRTLTIVDSGAESMRVPYVGQCENHGDVYGRLAGLNLLRGFRQALRERVGGALGCTHITELAQTLPTAVVQAFAGEVIDTRGLGDERPFQIDRCHALRSDGEAVRAHYPRWYRAPSKPAAGPHAGEASAPGPRQPAQDAGTGRPARDPDPGRSARVPHPGPAARDPA
ncbi:MAG: DUF2889 domain-containing protein [Rhodoferax sp.]|jgi:hypothetical protein|nr:DUF2889 domain-containing protein [Rhodoferax sp.]MCL4737061.1 DUF2889 domain-containing protein [Burkholderiaceae bacterium]MCP5289169.1 DUF2889 domain-containing protein [Burkholderiaceae bacterium]